MSSYSKSTNFTTKDGLSTGDPGKLIKGSEVDAELIAVESAINSKADLDSPTLTGIPSTPPASAGTNSTQIASTAFVTTAVTNATGSLGTLSTQDADSVAITGGTLTGTTVNGITVGSNGSGTKTISTASPSGGADGDIWYKVAS